MKMYLLIVITLFIGGASLAQNDGYIEVKYPSDYEGIWIAKDTVQMQLLKADYAPVGAWLIIDKTSSYFSSFLDPEWGASIDIGFTYKRKSNVFKCKLIESNSIGYLMEHENEPFRFKLYYKFSEDEHFLRLENAYGTTYDLVMYMID